MLLPKEVILFNFSRLQNDLYFGLEAIASTFPLTSQWLEFLHGKLEFKYSPLQIQITSWTATATS